jgi:hypothetical protein
MRISRKVHSLMAALAGLSRDDDPAASPASGMRTPREQPGGPETGAGKEARPHQSMHDPDDNLRFHSPSHGAARGVPEPSGHFVDSEDSIDSNIHDVREGPMFTASDPARWRLGEHGSPTPDHSYGGGRRSTNISMGHVTGGTNRKGVSAHGGQMHTSAHKNPTPSLPNIFKKP